MAIFGIISVFIGLLLISVGLVLGLVALAMTVALTGLGIIAVSVLVGYWRQSVVTGFRVFFAQAGILMGMIAGAVTGWVVIHCRPPFSDDMWVIVAGGCAGSVAGILISLLAGEATERIAGSLSQWASTRVTWFTS